MAASSLGEAAAAVGLAGLTVGIFIAFSMHPSTVKPWQSSSGVLAKGL